MRTAAIVLGWSVAAACGDNAPGPAVGPPLASADTMFVIAHFDDDMIFMQPELLAALEGGSVTTVYVTSGDPVKGDGRADEVFAAARTAYSSVVGSDDWECGYVAVGELPVHHCRLRDRAVSLIGLDLPDGGLDGERTDSLLHLVEGTITKLPILGPIGGHATRDDVIAELAELIVSTSPTSIHALDVAATHGRDHSSHLMSSSFALWAAATVGYGGGFIWHRGYNVDGEAATLLGTDYDASAVMLGYFEACYFGCGPCGRPCTQLDPQENAWMERQYAFDRVRIASLDAAPLALDVRGHLRSENQCLAAGPDGGAALAACVDAPEQYWVLDDEGHVWNGAPPSATTGMDYDHVRCLAALDSAPTCGADLQPTWLFR